MVVMVMDAADCVMVSRLEAGQRLMMSTKCTIPTYVPIVFSFESGAQTDLLRVLLSTVESQETDIILF